MPRRRRSLYLLNRDTKCAAISQVHKQLVEADVLDLLNLRAAPFRFFVVVQAGRAFVRDKGTEASDQTLEFCHKIGLDYVSCSPYRVPIARFAAAQAALKGKTKKR